MVIPALSNCSRTLRRWSTSRTSGYEMVIGEKSEELFRLQNDEGSYNSEVIKTMQNGLRVMLENEDLMWRQRAKTD